MEKRKKTYKRRHRRKKTNRMNKWKWLLIVGVVALVLVIIFWLMIGKKSDDKSKVDLQQVQNVEELTWEEYQELTPEEKALIPDMFEDMESYNTWYEALGGNDEKQFEIEVLESNEKKAEDFTWEEYQELTIDEKAIFPDYFDTFEEYEQWYDSICPNE